MQNLLLIARLTVDVKLERDDMLTLESSVSLGNFWSISSEYLRVAFNCVLCIRAQLYHI